MLVMMIVVGAVLYVVQMEVYVCGVAVYRDRYYSYFLSYSWMSSSSACMVGVTLLHANIHMSILAMCPEWNNQHQTLLFRTDPSMRGWQRQNGIAHARRLQRVIKLSSNTLETMKSLHPRAYLLLPSPAGPVRPLPTKYLLGLTGSAHSESPQIDVQLPHTICTFYFASPCAQTPHGTSYLDPG